jgi:hypothetical protein
MRALSSGGNLGDGDPVTGWLSGLRSTRSGLTTTHIVMLSLKTLIPGVPVLTYDFRLPPGPRTAEYAILAEDLGFRRSWNCGD